MLGLRGLFSALSRLTAAVSRSAELFETANGQLERQLGLEAAPAALEHAGEIEEEEKPARRSGRK